MSDRLTNLENIRTIGRFENDRDIPRINAIIDQVSDAFATHCDRRFGLATHSMWLTPEGQDLLLPHWPIREVKMLGYGCETVAVLRYTAFNAARYASVGLAVDAAGTMRVATTIFNSGDPATTYVDCTGKTVGQVAQEVASNPDWTCIVYPRAEYIPSYCLWPDLSEDAIIGVYFKAPVRLVPTAAMLSRSERGIEQDCPTGWRMFVRWIAGYNCFSDADNAPAPDLPPGLVDIATRCVIEATQASMDVQFQRKAVVYDWIRAHSAELLPYKRLG